MRKICLIGLGCVLALHGAADAGTTGFLDNSLCDTCVNFTLCAFQEYQNFYSMTAICDHVAANPDRNGVIEKCLAQYPAVSNAGDFDYIAHTAVLQIFDDKCLGYDTPDTGIAFSSSMMSMCSKTGYCVCKKGYYIQPRGLNDLEFGKNSECRKCPDAGTTDDEYALGLYMCYISAGGSFSDETGSGIVNSDCHAGFDNAEEERAAFQ